ICPGRGNRRSMATRVCAALAYSSTSRAEKANRSTTWPPSTSTTLNRPPASIRTARASRAGTGMYEPAMCAPAEAPPSEGSIPVPDGGRGRLDFPFVGIPSFLRSRIVAEVGELDADVAVVGAPTDEGSPFMPGSRFGPRSIREHSLRFLTDTPGYFD